MPRKCSHLFIIAIFLVMGFVFGSGCKDTRPPQVAVATSETAVGTPAPVPAVFGIGKVAPDFTLTDIKGREVSLADFRGKAVIVDFWATWCGPCRMTMPHLQALSQQYPEKLVVLAVSVDRNPREAVPPYVQKSGLTFTFLADPRGMEVAQAWGQVQNIPTTYLVDPAGVVVKKWIGANPKEVYEAEVVKVLPKS